MGKPEWGVVVVLLVFSSGWTLADTGKLRADITALSVLNQHVTGTISRINGKRLRVMEDPDPMGCATSGIKLVDIVEDTKLFRGESPIADKDLQRGDRVIIDATTHGEVLQAVQIRVQDATAPDHAH